MTDIICHQRLNQQQAHDFFVNLDFDKLKNGSLWAEFTFRGDDKIIILLRELVFSLYKNCGYELVVGTFENSHKFKGPLASGVPVGFWAKAEPDDAFRDDTIDYSYRMPLVDLEDPSALVQQAIMLREGFQQGYTQRTKEVRSNFAGMMGITESHLVNGILDTDRD